MFYVSVELPNFNFAGETETLYLQQIFDCPGGFEGTKEEKLNLKCAQLTVYFGDIQILGIAVVNQKFTAFNFKNFANKYKSLTGHPAYVEDKEKYNWDEKPIAGGLRSTVFDGYIYADIINSLNEQININDLIKAFHAEYAYEYGDLSNRD